MPPSRSQSWLIEICCDIRYGFQDLLLSKQDAIMYGGQKAKD